jgi:hypothetical protein
LWRAERIEKKQVMADDGRVGKCHAGATGVLETMSIGCQCHSTLLMPYLRLIEVLRATYYVVARSTRWRRGSFCKSRAMDGDGGAVTSTKCPGLHPIVHGKVDGAPVRAQRDRYRRRHFSRACSSGFLQFLRAAACLASARLASRGLALALALVESQGRA